MEEFISYLLTYGLYHGKELDDIKNTYGNSIDLAEFAHLYFTKIASMGWKVHNHEYLWYTDLLALHDKLIAKDSTMRYISKDDIAKNYIFKYYKKMILNQISDFKPGQVIEVLSSKYAGFSRGTIGVVCRIPERNAVFSYSTATHTDTVTSRKNTTIIEFFNSPHFGNGMRLSSNVHIEDVRILDCFYYFDFEHNKVVRHEISDTIDSFGYYLLRDCNFFASEKDASQFGFSQNSLFNDLLEVTKIKKKMI